MNSEGESVIRLARKTVRKRKEPEEGISENKLSYEYQKNSIKK